MPGREYIEADEVRKRPFRVAVAPLPSLQSALVGAVGTGRKGTPLVWRRAIRAQLRQIDYDVLAPFATQEPTLVPDALIGLAEPPGESLKDGIERMIATPLDDLLADARGCASVTTSTAWQQLERDPARWLRRYVGSLLRAWKGFGPVWRHAQAALDREVERVGLATALDAQLELLDGLIAGSSVDAGGWTLRCSFASGRMGFPERGLVLMPLVAGDGGSIIDFAGSTIRRVAYPVRSLAELGAEEPPAASLEGLLGVPRARILRALECPMSIGRLAEALRAVPSAATHHVSALEAAGLVLRERSGRRVLVHRTTRGEGLVDLYEDIADSARWRGSSRRRVREVGGARRGVAS
jgi:DNA-binding transcriptional ArsR family regulator